MLAQFGAAAVAIGTQWVAKLLNKQPKDVSPYFSRNGEYLDCVNRQKNTFNATFSKYAAQLAEGSAEANEYLTIAKPALDWMGQRNAIDSRKYESLLESEGQRLVNQYQKQSVIQKAGNTLNAVTDPIKTFFSYFSLKKDEPGQAILGAPKTDTVIPITIEAQGAAVEEKATFEKFALPAGIAVVSVIVLLMLRR